MPIQRWLTLACTRWQVATLTEELELSRGGVRDQLKEKDAKINSLVEELGNSQAMLNDKVAELAEVCCCYLHQLLFYAASQIHKQPVMAVNLTG